MFSFKVANLTIGKMEIRQTFANNALHPFQSCCLLGNWCKLSVMKMEVAAAGEALFSVMFSCFNNKSF